MLLFSNWPSDSSDTSIFGVTTSLPSDSWLIDVTSFLALAPAPDTKLDTELSQLILIYLWFEPVNWKITGIKIYVHHYQGLLSQVGQSHNPEKHAKAKSFQEAMFFVIIFTFLSDNTGPNWPRVCSKLAPAPYLVRVLGVPPPEFGGLQKGRSLISAY